MTKRYVFMLLLCVWIVLGSAQQSLAKQPPSTAAPDRENQTEKETVAAPDGILTLKQALALVEKHNPALKALSLEVNAAQAHQLQEGLWPNPELDIEVENAGGTGQLSGFDGAQTTVQISQRIELGKQAQKRKRVAGFEKKLAEMGYENEQFETFAGVSNAFVQVLKAQEQLQISNQLLTLSEQLLGMVEKRVSAGKDSPLELNRASVDHARNKMIQSQASRDLKNARRQLSLFWGQNTPSFSRASGNLYYIQQPPSLADLAGRLGHNLEYLQWQAQVDKQKAAVDLEKSKSKGNVTVAAGMKRFNETEENAIVFGISIPLPLSNRNQGGRQEAYWRLAQSRAQQQDIWLKLQSRVGEVHRDLENAYNRAQSLKIEILPAATEMFDAATKAYQEGKIDYLNVLNVQRTLFDVKQEHVESLADYHAAETEIACCIGNFERMEHFSESEE